LTGLVLSLLLCIVFASRNDFPDEWNERIAAAQMLATTKEPDAKIQVKFCMPY
jgi:hypothetical protein